MLNALNAGQPTVAPTTPSTTQPGGAWTNCSGGYVGLTYDDGPNASNTTTLLSALTSNSIRATMFNIGQNAQNNQGLR